MEDLTLYFKELREIHREKKIDTKERPLNELLHYNESSCFICKEGNKKLCESCLKNLHYDKLNLRKSFFVDVYVEFKDVLKRRKVAVYEFLFNQVGSINQLVSERLEFYNFPIWKTLTLCTSRLSNILNYSFVSSSERHMCKNIRIRIKKEITKNYFLINLFNRAKIIEEQLQRMRVLEYNTIELENELMDIYKEVYQEL